MVWDLGSILGEFVLYEVGNNTQIWFWHGLWCGDNMSKDAYSELLHIAADRSTTVVGYMDWLKWNIT